MFFPEIVEATQQVNGQSDLRRLFVYRPEVFRHLLQFTEAVMRGPGVLTQGERELMAALTSKRNDCDY
jgi:alkylhydroperoxidase family enzyme